MGQDVSSSRRRTLRALGVFLAWLVFVLCAAAVIQFIEDERDQNLRSDYDASFRRFLLDVNRCGMAPRGQPAEGQVAAQVAEGHVSQLADGQVSARGADGQMECLTVEQLNDFIAKIEFPLRRGLATYISDISDVTATYTWTYPNSIFYICALVTTVGYGNIVPLSYPGKGFSIFVVVFGVPFTILLFSLVIERLLAWTNPLRLCLFRLFQRHIRSSVAVRLACVVVVLVLGLVLLVLLPATLFNACEVEWTYFSTIYYCALTLMTAGLGDVVPGMETECGDVLVVLTAAYIIGGVMSTMFVMANIYEIMEMEADEESAPLVAAAGTECETKEELALRAATPEKAARFDAKVHDFYLSVSGRKLHPEKLMDE